LLTSKYCEASDEKEKLVYATCLHTAMSVASRASKGFSNQIKVKDCMCVDIFVEILRIFIPAITLTTHKHLIQAGVRQYLHRMIVCLDNEVLEYIQVTVEHLLKLSNEPRDIHDLLPLINQIMSKYKLSIVPFMQRIFMQLVNRILNFVNTMQDAVAASSSSVSKSTNNQSNNSTSSNHHSSNTSALNSSSSISPPPPSLLGPIASVSITNNDGSLLIDAQLIQDVQLLYKSYFTFLLNIVNNDLLDIVTIQESSDVYKVFFTLIQAAQNGTQDTPKCCLQVIRKFVTVFVEKQNIPDFVQYTMQNVVPCCFQIFTKPIVDLNDAQTVLTFNEVGQCLILLYSKFGDDFIKYLENTYLPSLQFNTHLTQAILQTIKSNNPKGFKSLRESIQNNQTR
jgi:exportin-T